MSLHPCRIVLVRPEVAGNIGSTARVMHNFGLSDLVLVAPVADPLSEQARKRSTQGEFILHRARTVPALDEALTDCVLVAGTAARVGGPFRRQSVGAPEEIMPLLVDAQSSGPTALVFGPEPSGLSNAEVTRCHHLIHISTDPVYPALNLAHAVAICVYELHKARLKQTPTGEAPPVAPFADQERMYAHLRTALEGVHFLYGTNADSLMHALRHLIGRARPSPMEVDLLFGLARQLRWYTAQHPRQSNEPG